MINFPVGTGVRQGPVAPWDRLDYETIHVGIQKEKEHDGYHSHNRAEDFVFLSHSQQQKDQYSIVEEHSARLGLNIHRGKSKILKSEFNQYSLSHTVRERDRRIRPFHISGQRR